MMQIFLECPECQNRVEDWKAAKLPDKTRVKLCDKCELRFAVIDDDLKAAEAAGVSVVTGVATAHQQRVKVAKPVQQTTPEPKAVTPSPQATTEPKASPPEPEPEPEPIAEPEPEAPEPVSNTAVYDDAKRRAAAAGMPVDEITESNPVLADAMRRARQ